VLAKWTDCKMYLAKVDEVCPDGQLHFYIFHSRMLKKKKEELRMLHIWII
jgi:hypothetical protein